MENILADCPQLQKLSIERPRFIDCSEDEPFHTILNTIEFSRSSRFDHGFLTRLFARAPNFLKLKLEIDRKEVMLCSGGEFYDIILPTTNFNTFTIDIETNDTEEKEEDDTYGKDKDISLKLSIRRYNRGGTNSPTAVTQFYHSLVSADSSSSDDQEKIHQLNLTHVCSDACQRSDKDMIVCSGQSC